MGCLRSYGPGPVARQQSTLHCSLDLSMRQEDGNMVLFFGCFCILGLTKEPFGEDSFTLGFLNKSYSCGRSFGFDMC